MKLLVQLPYALTCLLLSALLARADDLLDGFDDHAANASLLWGSYRPNLYVGLRPRLPESLAFGLIWYGAAEYTSFAKARHACEQDDGIVYAWHRHDGRSYGQQVIEDPLNNVRLSTTLLKVPGGAKGGSWALRIKGTPLKQGVPLRLGLVPYFGLEGEGSLVVDNLDDEEEGFADDVKLSGSTPDLGDFRIRVQPASSNRRVTRLKHVEDWGDRIDKFSYLSLAATKGTVWRAKDYFLNDVSTAGRLQTTIEKYGADNPPDPAVLFLLSNEAAYDANLHLFQKTFEGKFELDIFYDSVGLPSRLDGSALSAGLSAAGASFDDRFDRVFDLASKGYADEDIAVARQLVASMVGGIGYFYGSSIVDRSFAEAWDDEGDDADDPVERVSDPRLTDPRELFTATPSRPFFPRGFYWDEGFHLLVVGAWDNDLSLAILQDWVGLIDADGWVAREQILGEEARSKVPKEFWTQFPHHANPPTLIMAVTAFVRRLNAASSHHGDFGIGDADPHQHVLAAGAASTSAEEQLASRHLSSPALGRAYLRAIYPALKRHYTWFRRTQRGQVDGRPTGYRWRGRSATHVLTSGLDDYPRAPNPSSGELHLDLACWMAFFGKTMAEVAEAVGEDEDREEFEGHAKALWATIDEVHWNEAEQLYCDVSIDEDDDSFFVCHKGYISLFPLLLGLVPPTSPRLKSLLNLLHDPAELWSDYGLRSLSISHPLFGKDEDYWRGAIWLPMNYMALQSLHNVYARADGPQRDRAAGIYDELRDNIVQNVVKEYKRTGFAWEQYSGTTGEGRRSRPFTGWTSLVALIMAEQY